MDVIKSQKNLIINTENYMKILKSENITEGREQLHYANGDYNRVFWI